MDVDAPVTAWDEASETIYLRGALDSAGAVIYTIDRSFRIMHVNAAWDEFALANNAAHLQTPAVIGTNLLHWLHGEAREQTRRICEEIFRGERRRYETDFDCSSPTERRAFTMVISPLRDAAGAIVGATFVSHDITRRKLLEAEVEARNTELRLLVEELRRQHAVAEQEREKAERLARLAAAHAAQFGATIAAMADGVWIANEAGLIVTVNDAGLHMFGLRRDEVVGQPVEALPHLVAVCRGERRHLGLRLALGGASIREECDVQLPDAAGPVTVDISATPVRNEAGAVVGAVAVVRDITQAKAMARLKDDFLSVAAHELKTPITALKGFTQLALRRSRYVPELEGLRRALHTIDEQADRITNLVHELLDANRIHAGKLELRWSRFELGALIALVAERARQAAPEHTVDVAPFPPVFVTADMERLEQVLYNLVDNAIKYSPGGGAIRIDTEVAGERAMVTVHDQGVGIPAEKLPHIFEPWYQAHYGTSGDYGGMGLGLYICKEIIERHGGHMWATSEENGSSVGFSIPLRPPSATQLSLYA